MKLPFCRKSAPSVRGNRIFNAVHALYLSCKERRYLLWFAPGAMLVLVGVGLFIEPTWFVPLLALFLCVFGVWLVAVIAMARRVFQLVNRVSANVVAQVRIAGVAPAGPFEQSPEGEIKKVVLH